MPLVLAYKDLDDVIAGSAHAVALTSTSIRLRTVVTTFDFATPRSGSQPSIIELKIERVEALFDAFDPFPLVSRDLSHAVDDYVIGWARELSPAAPWLIRLHIPVDRAGDAAGIGEAFRTYFTSRARVADGDLRELFRFARRSLAVGLVVLAACIVSARVGASIFTEPSVSRILSESLLVLGWVSTWRPIELLLYDWWPIRRRRELCLKLAATPIDVVSGDASTAV
ncbi:MAG: hypothetical protein KJS97_14470 [Alphaproteobacteria bacterium]|nr:hypothetical protein [Alphaproteobacteria bacterium]